VVAVVSRAAPHPRIPEVEQLMSAGNAAMNLVLAVHALGFAAQWTTGWIAYDEDAGRILGLQPGERFVGFVHIGTATAPATDRPRPALSEIVSDWRPPA
jgi:nitroreductase